MKTILFAFALLLGAFNLHAQPAVTPGVLINAGAAKSNWVASTTPVVWRSVVINNPGAVDYWVMVFDSKTNQLDNAAVQFSAVKVTAGTTGFIDPPSGPVNFSRGLNICASTTPVTLTNAGAAGLIFTVIRNP